MTKVLADPYGHSEGYYVQQGNKYAGYIGWSLIGDKAYVVHAVTDKKYQYRSYGCIGWRVLKELPKDLQDKLNSSAKHLRAFRKQEEKDRQVPKFLRVVDDFMQKPELTDDQLESLLANRYTEALDMMPFSYQTYLRETSGPDWDYKLLAHGLG